MRRTLMLLVVSATMLAGCQTMTGKPVQPPTFKQDKPCTPNQECVVWVEPNDEWVPRKIIMAPGAGKREVQWRSWWAFENGGILFDKEGRDALAAPCTQGSPWTVTCEFKPTIGEFKYTIDVIKRDPIDPWYVNK